jgi:hypothetical protein
VISNETSVEHWRRQDCTCKGAMPLRQLFLPRETLYVRACRPFILLTLLPIGQLAHAWILAQACLYRETRP